MSPVSAVTLLVRFGLSTLPPFPPLPLSIPPKFSDKPVGGKVRSSEGEVPRLPPYKYHPGQEWHPTCKKLGVGVTI